MRTDELVSLQAAAHYLEAKMIEVRDVSSPQIDRVAVITALNITHQFLNIDAIIDERTEAIQQRIVDLHRKVDDALINPLQTECASAE